MAKSRERIEPHEASAVTWERVRRIFDFPKPPHKVWERQFDNFDAELRTLAQTPYDEIDFSDLWYYFHDLAYTELQPEVFAYLFPVCLMDWHCSLMANEPCAHGDADFHYGLRHGEILEKMLTPEQREEVFEFFRDSFLERLDTERGFVYDGSKTPAYGWMGRFNTLGAVMPRIARVWEQWWSLATPGRAVAALQYCSGLMYAEGENPLFGKWTREGGGGGPYLWVNDTSIHDAGWLPENVDFLKTILTPDFVADKVKQAAERLSSEPERETAQRIAEDLPHCQDLVELRAEALPRLLNQSDGYALDWSV